MSSRGAPGSSLPELHSLHRDSYRIFCLLQSSTVSSPWLHRLQLFLTHFWPDQGFLLLKTDPRLLIAFSTTFRVNPIIGDSLDTVDLISLASMPPVDCSTNRTLTTLSSGGGRFCFSGFIWGCLCPSSAYLPPSDQVLVCSFLPLLLPRIPWGEGDFVFLDLFWGASPLPLSMADVVREITNHHLVVDQMDLRSS